MQILTDFGVDWHLLLVSAVNFAVLVAILWFILAKPLVALLLERETTIKNSLDQAEKERKEAAKLEKRLAADRAKAVEEAKQMLADATKRHDAIVKQAEQDADKRAGEILTAGEAKLVSERRDMLEQATQELADVVVQATNVVLGETVKTDIDKALVDKALKGVK